LKVGSFTSKLFFVRNCDLHVVVVGMQKTQEANRVWRDSPERCCVMVAGEMWHCSRTMQT